MPETISSIKYFQLDEIEKCNYWSKDIFFKNLKKDFLELFKPLLNSYFFFIDVIPPSIHDYKNSSKTFSSPMQIDIKKEYCAEYFHFDYIHKYEYSQLFNILTDDIYFLLCDKFKEMTNMLTKTNLKQLSFNDVDLTRFDYFWCNDKNIDKLLKSKHVKKVKEGYRFENAILIPLIEKSQTDNELLLFKKGAITFYKKPLGENMLGYPIEKVDVKGVRISIRYSDMLFSYLETPGKLLIDDSKIVCMDVDKSLNNTLIYYGPKQYSCFKNNLKNKNYSTIENIFS